MAIITVFHKHQVPSERLMICTGDMLYQSLSCTISGSIGAEIIHILEHSDGFIDIRDTNKYNVSLFIDWVNSSLSESEKVLDMTM